MWMWIGPTFRTEGFGAIGPGLLAKHSIHIPYVPVPEWFRNDPKLDVDPRAQKRPARAVGGVQWTDGGCGHVGDRLPLPEWEPFAESVAPMVEGVQTDVDATMEALCQQHDIDVQAYKARIEHLEFARTRDTKRTSMGFERQRMGFNCAKNGIQARIH